MQNKILLPVDESSETPGIGRTLIYGFFRDGSLKPIKIGRRTFIHRDDLNDFIEQRRAASAT
jgi:hypothetical protein